MKKNILIIATAFLSLAGCVNNKTTESTGGLTETVPEATNNSTDIRSPKQRTTL